MSVLVDEATVEALLGGRHAILAVLGMHETDNGIEVRVLMPDASRVAIIDKESQQEIVEMDCLHEDGFFAVVIPEKHDFFAYQLNIFWGNENQILEDPYRFRPILSELDNWLLAEGTHYRPYEKLGRISPKSKVLPGLILFSGHRMPSGFLLSAISISGMVVAIRCVSTRKTGCGKFLSRKQH